MRQFLISAIVFIFLLLALNTRSFSQNSPSQINQTSNRFFSTIYNQQYSLPTIENIARFIYFTGYPAPNSDNLEFFSDDVLQPVFFPSWPSEIDMIFLGNSASGFEYLFYFMFDQLLQGTSPSYRPGAANRIIVISVVEHFDRLAEMQLLSESISLLGSMENDDQLLKLFEDLFEHNDLCDSVLFHSGHVISGGIVVQRVPNDLDSLSECLAISAQALLGINTSGYKQLGSTESVRRTFSFYVNFALAFRNFLRQRELNSPLNVEEVENIINDMLSDGDLP